MSTTRREMNVPVQVRNTRPVSILILATWPIPFCMSSWSKPLTMSRRRISATSSGVAVGVSRSRRRSSESVAVDTSSEK